MGTVRVRTDFAGGNGIICDLAEAEEQVQVDFAPDPMNCPEAMWFHFRVEGLAGRELACRLTNAEQTLGGADWSGNHPVYRGDGGEWERCGPPSGEVTPSGRRLFTYTVPGGFEAVEFAHCYPYQPEHFEGTVAEVGDAWQGEVLGYSHHGRPVRRYVSDFGSEGDTRPGFYLLARQHAGETPGSWVMDGLVRFLASEEGLKTVGREMVVWLVPFVNIDDVVEGSYGKDPSPCDCNRAWFTLPLRTEVKAIADDIRRWSQRCRPRFLIDIHAPAHSERDTYVHLPRAGRPQRERDLVMGFAERFHQALPADLRSPKGWTTPDYPSRFTVGTTVSAWFYDTFEVPAAGVEISYQGTSERDYTVADYRRIGRCLAGALADLAKESGA